jgi:hypothetical protein
MIIGIDFSINSTAVSIRDGDDLTLMSFVPNLELGRAAWRVHESLQSELNIFSYQKDAITKNAMEDQQIKIRNADRLSSIIIDSIGESTLQKVERINIEGFSYASKGNAFIDIITYNTFLKCKMYQIVKDRIFVIPPKTLKKIYTGNGNATKCDMLRSYLGKNDNQLCTLIREVVTIKEEGEFPIPKPIDDVIDSIALTEIGTD